MNTIIHTFLLAATAAASFSVQAASKHDYTYTPVAGVHETKYFHGCYDNTDIEKRPKIDVTMNGLSTTDVLIQTRPREEGKPTSELVTFRVRNMDASFSVLFRSNDGPHCQQGVQRIIFSNATVNGAGDLARLR